MRINHKIFFSKLLLFGEYTVTVGSGALALPYTKLGGYWDFGTKNTSSDYGLSILLEYLSSKSDLAYLYDLDQFKSDIDHGLNFVSTIPVGYGLGSSGALVAAFYDKYCISKTEDLLDLKSILGATECAFHGASSGLDPLVSYIGDPILITDDGKIQKANCDINDKGFFILDTGISRSTDKYVQIFKQKLKEVHGFASIVDKLSLENKMAISALMSNDNSSFRNTVEKISRLQVDHFQEMIPTSIYALWLHGLETGRYFLKLCGAGGGGMILGLMADPHEKPDFGPNFQTISL